MRMAFAVDEGWEDDRGGHWSSYCKAMGPPAKRHMIKMKHGILKKILQIHTTDRWRPIFQHRESAWSEEASNVFIGALFVCHFIVLGTRT